MSLRHNKKRNSFLIYEQLVSVVTRLAASGNKKEADKVVGFIKEFYSHSREIGKEYKLLDSLLESKFKSKEQASRVIEEAMTQSKFLNTKKLDREKTRLIESINRSISKHLFSIPIKNYKTIASAQILINEARNNFAHTSPKERVKIKTLLEQRMVTPKERELKKVDNLTFNVLVNKFNKRYSKLINEDQREILSAWATYQIDSNEPKAQKVLAEKLQKARSSVSYHMASMKHNKTEYGPMLREAYSQLINKKPSLTEAGVYEIMRYFDLMEDLDNSNGQSE